MSRDLETILAKIRACRHCEKSETPLPHTARPVVRASAKSRIRIIGQAPGTRVHASGIPFDDPSGERLRNWLGVSAQQFYDTDIFAITPMGFCFPGLDTKGGDLPPRRECVPLWQSALSAQLPNIQLTLLIGQYAQKQFLDRRRKTNLTETVRAWREYGDTILPLPHPSWRNNSWIRKNPWFEETLADLKRRVHQLIQRDHLN